MYFESRHNHIIDLSMDPIESQTMKIKTLPIGYAIKINNILWVNDESPSGTGIKEAAILYQFEDRYIQFESVTVDWCSEHKLQGYIKSYMDVEMLKQEYQIDECSTVLFNQSEAKTWFDCGCCGTSFMSTRSYQSQFDQDAGYGLCSSCE